MAYDRFADYRYHIVACRNCSFLYFESEKKRSEMHRLPGRRMLLWERRKTYRMQLRMQMKAMPYAINIAFSYALK